MSRAMMDPEFPKKRRKLRHAMNICGKSDAARAEEHGSHVCACLIDGADASNRRTHRFFLSVLWRTPESGKARPLPQSCVMEQELMHFEHPDASAHASVPSHGMSYAAIWMEERP
ncbi:MAG: hypothetical protein ACRCTI_13785, partial [Beijerinckiaceae bacterium]